MKNQIGRSEVELRLIVDEKIQELESRILEKDKILDSYRKDHGVLDLFFRDVTSHIDKTPPQPMLYKPVRKTSVDSPCAAVMHITDAHMGAIQIASEIEGFGEYSPEISRTRQMTFAKKIIDWTETNRSAYTIPELHVLVTGDLMCFPEGTPVTLENGSVKNIEEIKAGDIILSDPDPRKVLAVHSRDHKENENLIEVRLCKVPAITATSGHIVKRLKREAVETGWNPGGKKAKPFVIRDKTTELSLDDIDECSLGELRVGDYMVIRPFRPTNGNMFINIKDVTGLDISKEDNKLQRKVRGLSPTVVSNSEIEIDNDFLWLVGLFIAEGSFEIGRSGHINGMIFTLNINEDILANKIIELMRIKFGYEPRILKNPDTHVQNVYVNNQIIATLFHSLCGRGCMEKLISDVIYTAPRSLLPLVGGWIDGDGGMNKRYDRLTGVTVNPSLARQISTILWSERVAHAVKEDDTGRNRMAYRISLSGAYAQQITSYTLKHKDYKFKPTYEDGFWIEDCYCVRVMSFTEKKATTKLCDLTIEDNHYYQVNGLVVHNSGDIHEELRITNAFPAPVQVVEAANVLNDQISMVAPHFEKVIVQFVSEDNHARLTKKPQAKEAGYNSFNYLIGYIAKERSSLIKNVEFHIYPQYEAVVNVMGRRYLLCHGHNVQGWAGIPFYGWDRKVAKEAVRRMNAPDPTKFHRIIAGHFHTPMCTPYFWLGGSVSGSDAYDAKNGRHSEPSQAAWMVHPVHTEFARTDFNLR
jgi:Hom_end-associated Hint.